MTAARKAYLVGILVDMALVAFGIVAIASMTLVTFEPIWSPPPREKITLRAGFVGFHAQSVTEAQR